MGSLRSVTLELLRHGPPHNQLLSPLTQYLGLCGNHGAVSVRVPQEHAQFVARLEQLSYRTGVSRTARELQLDDTARLMRDVLAQVPGLAADLALCGQRAAAESTEPLTHLELVLSAAELALLPFEMADAPNGLPGAGQPLLLQPQNPICLTRRVRRVEEASNRWTGEPRVLFIAAAPPTVGPIPVESHVCALVEAIDPWVRRVGDPTAAPATDEATGEELSGHVGGYHDRLTILPAATVRDIQRECARRRYTHVHVLAHGKLFKQGVDDRFGIVLHHPDDPNREDVVDGRRLATLLRAYDDFGEARSSAPNVVTLACCEGGQQGTTIGAGSSVAHALHEAGVPLVVASQFPLTFAGSVTMVESLYHGLLRGYDPRYLLAKLRRELKASQPETHDWASLVAYAAFPPDFDDQLEELRMLQARRSMEIAFAELRTLIGAKSPGKSEPSSGPTLGPAQREEELKQCRRRVAKAKNRLMRAALAERGPERGENLAKLAAAEKREAEIEVHLAPKPSSAAQAPAGADGASSDGTSVLPGATRDTARRLLETARRHYREAFTLDRKLTWALVQSVSLDYVLYGPQTSLDDWTLARLLSERELLSTDSEVVDQAYANLIELYLIGMGRGGAGEGVSKEQCEKQVRKLSDELAVRPGTAKFWNAQAGQLRRYSEWFDRVAAPQGVAPGDGSAAQASLADATSPPAEQTPQQVEAAASMQKMKELAAEIFDRVQKQRRFDVASP